MTSLTSPVYPRIGLEIAPESGAALLQLPYAPSGIGYFALRHRPSSRFSLHDLLLLHQQLTLHLELPVLLHLPFQRLVLLSSTDRADYLARLGEAAPGEILAVHGDSRPGPRIPIEEMCRILTDLRDRLPESRILVAGHPSALLDSQSRHHEEERLRAKYSCSIDGILTQMLSTAREFQSYAEFAAEIAQALPVFPGIPLSPSPDTAERFHLSLPPSAHRDSRDWTCALAESILELHPEGLHFFGTHGAASDIRLLTTYVLPRIQDENRDIVQSLNADDT